MYGNGSDASGQPAADYGGPLSDVPTQPKLQKGHTNPTQHFADAWVVVLVHSWLVKSSSRLCIWYVRQTSKINTYCNGGNTCGVIMKTSKVVGISLILYAPAAGFVVFFSWILQTSSMKNVKKKTRQEEN